MPSFQVDDDLDDDCFLDQYLPQAESSRISFPPDHQKTNENQDDQQNKICNMDFQQPEHIEGMYFEYLAVFLLNPLCPILL